MTAAASFSSNGPAVHVNRWIAPWLFTMAALVFAMVVVGGATRLTGSGLSITEWQPIMGALPPWTEADWLLAFEKYRQIPQYALINKGMSLEAFKGIFWWEWGHRFLGRIVGVAFFLPFAMFVASGAVRGRLMVKLAGLLVLGGFQGALGWFMVQSGLSARIDVSQYRLAAHLVLASVLFAALLWTAFDVQDRSASRVRLRTLAAHSRTIAVSILGLVLLQIGAGALVAGLKAGLAYNTWPLMDGRFVPAGLAAMTPTWHNVFENAATVQFDHRMLAYCLAGLVFWQTLRVIRTADDEYMRRSCAILAVAVTAQIGLGIWTLLAHVPLPLALGHQATAMLVLAAAVWHLHALTRH